MFPSLPIEDKYCTSAGQVWHRSGVRQLPDTTLTPRWARWQNSTNTLHRWVWQVMTPFLLDRGRRLTNNLYFVRKLTMIIFHTANQTVDYLHHDYSATFHNCVTAAASAQVIEPKDSLNDSSRSSQLHSSTLYVPMLIQHTYTTLAYTCRDIWHHMLHYSSS